MEEYTENHLNNFIAGWYIPKELCQAIIDYAEELNQWKSGTQAYLDLELEPLEHHPLIVDYVNFVKDIIDNYRDKYPACHQFIYPNWALTDLRIQKYLPGNWYKETHCENVGCPETFRRHLVVQTYLNDVYNGGGTEFPLQEAKFNAEQGLTIIWPTHWTHQHHGINAPDEVKYIINGWVSFVYE